MVISPIIWVITTVTLLITLLITTHEPPSRAYLNPKELILPANHGFCGGRAGSLYAQEGGGPESPIPLY